VEIEQDVVFTLEYSVRAAQMAVYQLMGICRAIPPVKPHDKSLHAKFEALLKSLV
jgi:oleate hydratase